jgi:hypothetical protein
MVYWRRGERLAGIMGELRRTFDNTRRKQVSAKYAYRCWTGAMQTSENSDQANFGEHPFYDIRE